MEIAILRQASRSSRHTAPVSLTSEDSAPFLASRRMLAEPPEFTLFVKELEKFLLRCMRSCSLAPQQHRGTRSTTVQLVHVVVDERKKFTASICILVHVARPGTD